LALTNTLAFNIAELITAVKSFMIQAPGGKLPILHPPTFSAVIDTIRVQLHCENVSSNYYKTVQLIHF